MEKFDISNTNATTDILYVGIDPDVTKSGYAVVDKATKRVTLATTDTFFGILERLYTLRDLCALIGTRVIVVIEAGWLNTGNWHLKNRDSKTVAAAKGRSQGENHQVGKLLVEFCKRQQIEHIEAQPLIKCWQGPDRKITHSELSQFATGLPLSTNQEVRDAVLLAWNYANLPIRIKPEAKQKSIRQPL